MIIYKRRQEAKQRRKEMRAERRAKRKAKGEVRNVQHKHGLFLLVLLFEFFFEVDDSSKLKGPSSSSSDCSEKGTKSS